MNPESEGLWIVSASGEEERFLGSRAMRPTWNPNSMQLLYAWNEGANGATYWMVDVGEWQPRQVALDAEWVFAWMEPLE